jgi:hypothetical protein
VFSYTPTKTGLDQFFTEVLRTLKPGGVFVYRDPKWDENPEQDCLLIIKNTMAKYFTTLFLPRFLDRTFSSHVDYQHRCIKPETYQNNCIFINFHPHQSTTTQKVSLADFVNVPTYRINFKKNISIQAPRGLISEIQRHYILFLKNVFITDIIDKHFFEKQEISLDKLPHQESEIFKQFLQTQQIPASTISTATEPFQAIMREKKKLHTFMQHGITIELANPEQAYAYRNKFDHYTINPALLQIENNTMHIDPKIATLIYRGDNPDPFTPCKGSVSDYPQHALNWIHREGEEFYFYKTTDELITYVAQLSEYYLHETDKDGYILCPLDAHAIKTSPRHLYKSIVEKQMPVIDIDGNIQDIIFDKNIIHFTLMKKEKAYAIYGKLIAMSPNLYPKLTQWIENE